MDIAVMIFISFLVIGTIGAVIASIAYCISQAIKAERKHGG